MKKALIFPGQGSQSRGMGEDILDKFSKGQYLMSEANEILGYNLGEIIKEDPENKLNQTKYTQPALFTISVIYTEYLREKGLEWQAAAGHSLGEYAALYAAGVYSFADGLTLVSKRGKLMQAINDETLGMAAVVGLSGNEVQKAISKIENVYVANLNAPEQTVLSGKRKAIESVGLTLRESGRGRLIPLKVKGAFHSPFMKPVEEEFKLAVKTCLFDTPNIDVYPNVLAIKVNDSTVLKQCLIDQICGQVRWTETVSSFERDGIDGFYEAGPGKVLKGLMKKCSTSISEIVI